MRFSVILSALPLGFAASQRALLVRPRGDAEVIAGKYIVKLKPDMSTASFDKSLLANADHVYRGAFNGYSATLTDDALSALLDHPGVSFRGPKSVSPYTDSIRSTT